METTTASTCTTDNLADMDDDDFEAYAAWVEAGAKRNAPKRYARRDNLGRFVKAHHIEEMRAAGVFVNDDNGMTHSHTRCGNLKGTTWDFGTTAEGFLCCACVEVPMKTWIAARNVAPTAGTQICDGCHTEKGMRKFPTEMEGGEGGWRVRGTTCRDCNSRRRSMVAAA